MIIRWIKPLSALCFLLLVALNPTSALNAASGSLAQWALSVAPALLPFLLAAPALTTPEVCALFARASGGFLRFMRLPKNAAGALLIGLLSGSPSGAAALARIPRDQSDPPGGFLRAALIASGASPAFLLSGVAAGMLDRPELGWLLVRSQVTAVLLTGIILRRTGSSRPAALAVRSHSTQNAVSSAMQTLLVIGGYMALFSVLAAQLSLLLRPDLKTPLLVLFELAGGCRALADLHAPLSLVLPLLSAAACFGGVSVYAQSMSFLSSAGVDPVEYAAGKLIQAALAASVTFLQLKNPVSRIDPSLIPPFLLCLLLSALLLCLTFKRRAARGVISSAKSMNKAA